MTLRSAACLLLLSALSTARAQHTAATPYARAAETDRAILIETDRLQAVIPKNHPRHWMTGIEKGSFLDRTTGFREAGDGLMVVDWLMEPGSDADDQHQILAPEGLGLGRYTWFENESDPQKREYARLAHGTTRRKRIVEGPQLCHRMKPVQPDIIRGRDFVAVQTSYAFEYAAPGRKPGSKWTQLVVFPQGVRHFLLMDRIDSVNASPELFLRNDTPGCVRHNQGDTFSEIYLSYLGGPDGLRIPASEFFTPFPPDEKFHYARKPNAPPPASFIRAYHLRDPATGKEGPWLAGITLEPQVVYEAWCSQRPGNIIVMIEEIHGKPTQPGDSFSAAHIVGYFDSIAEMHALFQKYQGQTALHASTGGWSLSRTLDPQAR